jgi:hypothetical protein
MITDMTHTVDSDTAKKTIGRTWFDLIESQDSLCFETREHGDIGEETYGEADLTEARRIFNALKEVYPPEFYIYDLDTCDEWVTLTIKKEPRTEEEIRNRKLEKQRKFILKAMEDLRNETSPRGEKVNPCIRYARITGRNQDVVEFTAIFGERKAWFKNYQAIPQHNSLEDALSEAKAFIDGLPELPISEWTHSVGEPTEKRSFDGKTLIEVMTAITYRAEIQLEGVKAK